MDKLLEENRLGDFTLGDFIGAAGVDDGDVRNADEAKDHGGHAGAATVLIEQAIREVREGIRYRNEHGK